MNPIDILAAGRFGAYVATAYAISAAGVLALTGWTLARAAYWKRRAVRATARRRSR